MAIEHVGEVLHGLFGVTPSEKLVALIIAEHTRRDTGLAWPSIETLARLACLERRQVQTIIATLRFDGWLSIENLGDARRVGRAGNVYRLNRSRLVKVRGKNDATGRAIRGDGNNAADRAIQGPGIAQSGEGIAQLDGRNSAVHCAGIAQSTAPYPLLNLEPVTDPEPTRAPTVPQAGSGKEEEKGSTPEPENHPPVRQPDGNLTAEEEERRRQAGLAGLRKLARTWETSATPGAAGPVDG